MRFPDRPTQSQRCVYSRLYGCRVYCSKPRVRSFAGPGWGQPCSRVRAILPLSTAFMRSPGSIRTRSHGSAVQTSGVYTQANLAATSLLVCQARQRVTLLQLSVRHAERMNCFKSEEQKHWKRAAWPHQRNRLVPLRRIRNRLACVTVKLYGKHAESQLAPLVRHAYYAVAGHMQCMSAFVLVAGTTAQWLPV